jgi:RNA-directed DNA polymerase
MSEPKPKDKPFAISKWIVWEAYQRVKANDGAAGVDDESIEEFERDLKGNLDKLWNRLSSGSYFPAPVRAVEIPKRTGQGVRILGVPTVADRIAQTVARLYLEPKVEPQFHPDSYGYRPRRSALQAVGTCRERCWRKDWVIDLDIRAFFDSVSHELVLRAVRRHTDERWILLYVERWLKAPLQQEDGTLVQRDRGTPQGSSISPLLANLFLHYAFDVWMGKQFPDLQFERYCDDGVVHCKTEKQAQFVRDAIARRLAECGLELHPDKTRIVYCKDEHRRATYANERFDFLGYTFRPRRARNKAGEIFVNFLPAVSDDALKEMGRELRSWRINRRSDKALEDLAQMVNTTVQGWINYYGRFYRTGLDPLLRRINEYLVRWAKGKYKRLHRHTRRAKRWLVRVARREPTLFVHWRMGARPKGWTMGAG